MKNLIKFGLFSFFLLSDFVMFAQPGDEDDNGGGGLEGNDPAPAPINSKLIILLVLGLVFAFYKLKKSPKKV
jgi:hypothetical protein